MENKTGIDVAASGGTGKAGKWREAHSRIYAFAILDGTSRSAGAEVQSNDVDFAERFGKIACYGFGDESVGEAVEAVFAEAVLFGLGGVDHVCSRWGWDGGVESGVEERDVRCFGDGGVDGLDDFESAGVV